MIDLGVKVWFFSKVKKISSKVIKKARVCVGVAVVRCVLYP